MNSMEQTSSPTGRTRESVRRSDLKAAKRIISSIQTSKYPISVELQAAIVTEALKKRVRRRERQANYRQRQLKTENDIQDEIVTLHAEIKELELRGQDPFHLPTTPTSWVLAAEYFRHLRHFLSTPTSLQTTTTDFLRGMLAPDVVGASSFGVAAQIENWKLFALYFTDADLELKGMSSPTPDTLVASTSTTVTITSSTLRYAFPHLNSDGNGGAQGGVWSPLAARMLEQKLLVRGWFTFGWDDSSDRVVRLQTRADMLSPMLKLLGSLEDVSCAFENAMITPECQFVRRE
uniref:BZIP domain-containing protein n=1 Tax=Phytophthora ramorum TaxID=164328 RepID=H3GN23_PHYRM